MSKTTRSLMSGEASYGEQLLNADQRAEADAMIRETCLGLGWPSLAERLKLPHRSGFIIYHVPGIAARALGCEPSAAAGAVMHVLTAAFKMIDWLLDEEDWPDMESEGEGRLANTAQAATAVAFRLVDHVSEDERVRLSLRRELEAMILPFCLAQDGSVCPERSQEVYWRTVDGTTGSLFSFGLSLGAQAVCGPQGAGWAAKFAPLGLGLARLLQVNDDLADAIKTPQEPDWTGRTLNLTILYAETADHPEREVFRDRLHDGSAFAEMGEMIDILFRSGAVSFSALSLISQYQKACAEVAAVAPPDSTPFEKTLKHLVAPSLFLLEEVTGEAADHYLTMDIPAFLEKASRFERAAR